MPKYLLLLHLIQIEYVKSLHQIVEERHTAILLKEKQIIKTRSAAGSSWTELAEDCFNIFDMSGTMPHYQT